MAIDQVSENVQRQERPIFSLKDFKNLSLNDQDILLDKSDSATVVKAQSHSGSRPQGTTSSSLWPPLKSARYCKKQRNRNGKCRGITPSIMLMHESSINHHRVSHALNELSCTSNYNGTVFDLSNATINNNGNRPFWSKRTCQEFWDEYLECDNTLIQDFSLLTIKPSFASDDHNCPRTCYTKITKSIRKLLKRTFTGAPTFSELETLVKSFNGPRNSYGDYELSCGQVLAASESGATIKLDTPFHRVWLHAICQYHGLYSQSKTVNDQRLVHIKTAAKNPVTPRINLYNFLLDFV